jgi:Winged helix DNA-binding domain
VRARSRGLVAGDVDRALDDGTLMVAWLARGTLHLVRAEDHGWLLGLTGPPALAASRRRLRELGVTERTTERGVAIVAGALGEEGPLDRKALARRLAAGGVRTEGQATVHVLRVAALRGRIALGCPRAGRPAFVGIDPPPPLQGDARDRALAELARRYLAGHGPASAADLARWAGLPLRDARAGLSAIAGQLADAGAELVDLAGRAPTPRTIAPRLLGPYDPYLLGWADRGFAVPDALTKRVHPGGGIVRAVATVDGRVVGTWSGRRPELDLGEAPSPRARAALAADAADVERFLG